ncbi:hypothetical protein EYF80_064797 [Liparis tanakae]|uniref:Uncharacterized protein n=1 Tax=Liparis tanakae TaxID=230148 RepID=A0A4Z2E821_9TELE|nr:hypothetical protein EYF80_064797 [Liparis tanakae]
MLRYRQRGSKARAPRLDLDLDQDLDLDLVRDLVLDLVLKGLLKARLRVEHTYYKIMDIETSFRCFLGRLLVCRDGRVCFFVPVPRKMFFILFMYLFSRLN